MINQVKIKIGESDLILETGRMAKQANGSVYASYEGSAVLATACCGNSPVTGLDYVPLQVEYNEKFYAAGKIPGGFLKREGRPKDKEILVCRLIDRPMRPLFDKAFGREIQVVPTVVSSDQINPPDMVAMVAASAAVVISDIPFDGPVGSVRIAQVEGKLIINPTFEQIDNSTLEIIVSGTKDGITMVEGGADEVSEETMLEAIHLAEKIISDICDIQIELAKAVGKEKLSIPEVLETLDVSEKIRDYAYSKMEEACFIIGKFLRHDAIKAVKKETFDNFKEDIPEAQEKLFYALFEKMEYEIVRKSILEKGIRTDGRGVEDIRPISCEIDILPRTHGSALFTRGETQSLAVTTLGTVYDEQMVDNIDGDKSFNNFMLHYNFPPFSVGETGRMGTGRREIGHGHLAYRAIEAILPGKDVFPYTIRIVSEILESNGSSSMASVCGGTLSLLNAGVPIKKPVAGIAMGLISDQNNAVVLSDILGEEDHLGDMDFKVTGSAEGITAFQMDIKISGVSADLMAKALEQAKKGRLHILNIMNDTIKAPREKLSEYAPKIFSFSIDTEKIGLVIGPGGKNIKAIAEKSGAEIKIDNDGKVVIYGKTQSGTDMAEAMVKGLIEEPEVGRIYTGTVKKILDFGAFIEILPGKEGLCHISKLSRERVNKVSDVLEMDQEISVKLLEIDRMGRLNLSYVDALETLEKNK
ncbi:MAG: polyribonucleotide nucleotidyltransferase [Spirochaetia bacterium]|jgi:polyribonucleotide nucleotidyltransferase|nr:polyribonucleotide nucleotidyltransferase [Spirochaetia bacterium]